MFIVCFLEILSDFLMPNRTIASPYSDTLSLMKRSALLILSMSVHHLNQLVGAGYPRPNSLTQNVSSVGGLRRFVPIGSPAFFAAFSILSKLFVILCAICGDSTSVSDDMM